MSDRPCAAPPVGVLIRGFLEFSQGVTTAFWGFIFVGSTGHPAARPTAVWSESALMME
ncbi:MAG TPA: hypothetical protein VIK38_09920 [Coriobacteriia bacterium]